MKTILMIGFALFVWMMILREETQTTEGQNSISKNKDSKSGKSNGTDFAYKLDKAAERLERLSQEQEISRISSQYSGSGSSSAGKVILSRPF